ncbi:hypothetical protein [Streptomyces canus]|uniref:hypothetical protein n=1 Tax=Streptomyces canus TaxID=58343 RepID=UPI002DD9AF9D|nr:hypothetical protein [Streptomyces canus]WSD82908.1 hypothetical protein OG925_00380 [Streptomyces canus]WSD91926.1 hypothetical protein OG925_50100 [Streptomyces canus]WSD92585.1 hypothetical protein OG925_50860 [Streptomyces canus]
MTEKNSDSWWKRTPSQRGMVITVLGIVTLGVAILSMYVSYQILQPKFGSWAVPTVGALDALWVVMQATEILSGNNRVRARRVQYAGLALTAINAAIPTTDLILTGHGEFSLAVILTPVAIVATKGAWWIALPALGRKVSPATRERIDAKRQQVADRLEEMEAEAADRIELLELATTLEERVAEAETAYRKSQLKIQQEMTEDLHTQAVSTAKTVSERPLPATVAAIRLPELGTWTPTAPALPVTADRDAPGADHPALPGGRDASGTDARGRHAGHSDSDDGRHGGRHAGRVADRDAVTLAQLATVAGVPTPQPGEPLTDAQLDVVLRHLRYREDPPPSYRKAGEAYRKAGFVGSEERVRRAWSALLSKEEGDPSESEEEEDADA